MRFNNYRLEHRNGTSVYQFFSAISKSLVYGLLNNYRSSIKSLFTRRADVYYKSNSDGTFEIINL